MPEQRTEADVWTEQSTVVRAGQSPPDWSCNVLDPGDHEQIRSCLLQAGYSLGPHLDEHGNCHVYLVRELKGGQQWAAKVLVDRLCNGGSALARFELESRLLATYDHPHLVKSNGQGTSGNVHFMILQVAAGVNLQRLVATDGPLSIGQAALAIQQTALALTYLHDRGVIHRDVKPSNIMRAADGRVILIDLGMARNTLSDASSITQVFGDRLLGTPDYMAPEQATDCHHVDARVDIYSLGCVLHFLLAGTPPFTAPTLVEQLTQHRSRTPPSLTTLRPEVPPALSDLCLSMIAKDADDRPGTAAAVAAVLEPWAVLSR